LASKLHDRYIQVIVLLLEICDIGIQVVFEPFIYCRPIFHLTMHWNRLAAGVCTPRDPLVAVFKGWAPGNCRKGKEGKARKKGRDGGKMDTPNFWNVALRTLVQVVKIKKIIWRWWYLYYCQTQRRLSVYRDL